MFGGIVVGEVRWGGASVPYRAIRLGLEVQPGFRSPSLEQLAKGTGEVGSGGRIHIPVPGLEMPGLPGHGGHAPGGLGQPVRIKDQ